MRKLPIMLCLMVAMAACSLDPEEDTWEYYEDWRNANNEWLEEQLTRTDENGDLYYQKIVPAYDENAYILIHYFNDQELTRNNLSPMITSTVDVKYRQTLYDGTVCDSTYSRTSPADSIYRSQVSGNISGFQIAMLNMHVGDSCDIVVPYSQAYGSVYYGTIPPYSHLRFDVKLADIYKYENY